MVKFSPTSHHKVIDLASASHFALKCLIGFTLEFGWWFTYMHLSPPSPEFHNLSAFKSNRLTPFKIDLDYAEVINDPKSNNFFKKLISWVHFLSIMG